MEDRRWTAARLRSGYPASGIRTRWSVSKGSRGAAGAEEPGRVVAERRLQAVSIVSAAVSSVRPGVGGVGSA